MSAMKFNVGDHVVYPAHGVGKVTGEEKQVIAGGEVAVYVISFAKDKMVLSVPVNRAERVGLRHLSTEGLMDEAIKTLQSKPRLSRGMWSRRAQEYELKINSGEIAAIAEVVRDLHKNVDDPDRSYSERMIYESALDRLAGEYAAIQNVDHKEATEALIKILLKSKEKEEETL